MKAIDRVTAHFRDLAKRSVEVPEWGEPGEPMVIYWSPWTLGQKSAINRSLNSQDMGYFADVLIVKAEDRDGKKIFPKEDKPKLKLHAHDGVVRRVALAILADEDPALDEADAGAAPLTDEQAEKN